MDDTMPLLEEAFDVPEEPDLDDDTYGLLYLGYLTDTVTIGDHEIRIRTLRVGEELKASLLTKQYRDTIEESRAYVTALVAAAITSVDGKPLIEEPLGPEDVSLEGRFDYILNNWYWGTVKRVFDAYEALVTRSRESLDEIKKG